MELHDTELRHLSDNLGLEWQKLATYLGFKRAKIQQFELESEHRGVENTVFDMLVSWRERQPKETNFRLAMKLALEKCERVDLAETIAPESPRATLDKIYSILKSKLDSNPEQYQDAILAFYNGIVAMSTDVQLSSALAAFGEEKSAVQEAKALEEKDRQEAIKRWRTETRIRKRNMQGEDLHNATGVALHNCGEVVVIDRNNTLSDVLNNLDNPKSPQVYGFSVDGKPKFVLTSTEPYEKTIGKLQNAQGIAATQDGRFIVADGTNPVKVFDIKGTYVSSFSTLSDGEQEKVRMRPKCVSIKSNGDVLIGDFLRECVTVHRSTDFSIVTEVYISVKPDYIAVNSHEHIFVCDLGVGKVIAFDYVGDELCTIEPKIGGKNAKPRGLAFDTDDNLLMAVIELDDSGYIKPNSGHIHHYNSKGGFLKCLIKGLRSPLGIARNNDLLAIANGDFVQICKAI